jgi:hypothetical protein
MEKTAYLGIVIEFIIAGNDFDDDAVTVAWNLIWSVAVMR